MLRSPNSEAIRNTGTDPLNLDGMRLGDGVDYTFSDIELPPGEYVVAVENLPAGFALETVQPETVSIRLSGKRRDLYFTDPTQLRVRVDGLLGR